MVKYSVPSVFFKNSPRSTYKLTYNNILMFFEAVHRINEEKCLENGRHFAKRQRGFCVYRLTYRLQLRKRLHNKTDVFIRRRFQDAFFSHIQPFTGHCS